MLTKAKSWLPEFLIAVLAGYFFLRELGSFPAPWADEGLFIAVAKTVTLGKGYALPLLDRLWEYPYFLNVGPTLIYPVALSLKLFGISSVAARIPMALYLALATALFYVFTRKLRGRGDARWATLLLVTFSGYVNTGKPVLGEIPAFAFLLMGLLVLGWGRGWKRSVGSGLGFGLAFLTKITFGLILPALGVAWLRACWKRDWPEVRALTVSGAVAALVFLPWRILEIAHTLGGSLSEEFHNFMLGGGDSELLYVLRVTPQVLLRLPYLAFAVLLVLGVAGMLRARETAPRSLALTVSTFIALFTLYFLNGYGWYRLLLPGHLLLLPFVPAGARALLRIRPLAGAALAAIIVAQFAWQLDHRGSNPSPEALEAVQAIEVGYADRALFIEQPEVYALLPDNSRWQLLVPPLSFSMPAEFRTISGSQCATPYVRKLNEEEIAALDPLQLTRLSGRYHVVIPPYPCPRIVP